MTDPAWEKSVWISILNSAGSKSVSLKIVMGATGHQLMMRLGDESILLAAEGAGGVLGNYAVSELISALHEGLAKLNELNK